MAKNINPKSFYVIYTKIALILECFTTYLPYNILPVLNDQGQFRHRKLHTSIIQPI